MVQEYEGKSFTSITKGSIDLSKFDEENKSEDKKKKSPKGKKSKLDFAKLIEKMKEDLSDNVKDVRLSTKLVGSPSCLVADDVGMDVQMERIMKLHDKDFSGMPRILELNEDHEFLIKLHKLHSDSPDSIKDAAFMLLDQAKIMEGQMPSDLAEFSRRLTFFMNKSLP